MFRGLLVSIWHNFQIHAEEVFYPSLGIFVRIKLNLPSGRYKDCVGRPEKFLASVSAKHACDPNSVCFVSDVKLSPFLKGSRLMLFWNAKEDKDICSFSSGILQSILPDGHFRPFLLSLARKFNPNKPEYSLIHRNQTACISLP